MSRYNMVAFRDPGYYDSTKSSVIFSGGIYYPAPPVFTPEVSYLCRIISQKYSYSF
jgi:hypothetical protein